MRKLLAILFFAPLLASREKPRQFFAITYYFAANGSDNNSGTSPTSPWQTITKFNSFAFQPLDSVVFNRGDSWSGTQMIIGRSGTSGNPIKIGTYGSGADPIISGLLTMPTSGWTNLTGNVWQRTVPGGLTSCKVLLFDGAFQAVSQYPRANNQYININTGTPGKGTTITTGSTGTITSTGVTANNTVTIGSVPGGLANVIGMQVVYRPMHWVFWRGIINAVNVGAGTITFTPEPSTSGGNAYSPIFMNPNYGFFFQNHPNLCTQQGDWAYNGTTLTVNFGVGGPTGHTVQVPTIDNLVSSTATSFVNISGINFRGANSYILNLNGCANFTLNSVTVFAGGIGGMIANNATTNFTSINCTYRNNNSYAMRSANANATAWNLTSNFFDHNGAIRGMGGVGEGEYFTVRDVKGGSTVRLNTWNTDGYCSISIQGSNNLVQNNFFNGYCTVKDDGAAIYTGGQNVSGTRIDGNIVINGQGIIQGTPDPDLRCPAIYVDDGGSNVEISNNTCAMNGDMGINIHNGHDLNIHNNTCYDNLSSAIRYYNDGTNGVFITNITLTQNIFFAKTTSELVSRASGGTASPSTYFATADNNKWCRPLDDPNGADFSSIVPNFTISTNLAGWRPFIGNKEINSTTCPWTITSVSQLRFEYNATNASANISLGGNAYVDVNGLAHSGTLTLLPWTSIIMKLTGTANVLPSVNAGPDQVITLPTSSVTMAGNATDADGTISSHTWSLLSGPLTPTITTPSSYTTTITGLTMAGVYVFQLSATDNSGGTSTDNMQVTVNPAVNQPPTANAGVDRTIQLPTNTLSQTGSGTDPDGTIAAYLWTQISGPSAATIVSATQATSSFSNLVAGIYVFNLRVTDNQGAVGNDQFQVTVLPAANQAPTANAGSNQTITLPTNSVTLVGSGTDVDGTIASYAWTKISGPSTFTIVSPNSSTTVVNNLVAGTYVFQLVVTDNQGATGSATVQVLVNPAPPPNQPPVVNAGTDKNITLPTNSITQVGSATDADGSVVSYAWTKISGPATFTIQSPAASTTVISNLVAGTYIFQLTATDNQGAIGTDQMTVIVNPAPNQPPVVNAGPDQTLILPTSSTNFAGSATDADGTITLIAWGFIGGPGPTPTIQNPNNLTSLVSNMTTTGSYTFQLAGTDNSGATRRDTMIILVNPAPNQPPVANAGADQNITLPVNSVTQVGSGSDPDGTITAYLWTKISGPTSFNIVSASQATTVINNLVAGTYVFNLRVTDNSGANANDQVTIVVSPAVNQPPIANAGTNQTITLPTNSVTLVGSGSDPDGTITAYLWTKISGPSTFTIVSPTSATTVVNNLVAGTYIFQLQVTDNQGATATNTVQVIVNPAPPPNQPPIANAGTDKNITLPTNSVTQVGSGTDADGTVVSYAWSKISGPATFTIGSPTASTTTLSNLVAGTYVFRLTVTDNQGATGTDDMTVIVNPAPNIPPTVNAGNDQILTLPTSSSTLTGSAADADGTITSHTWTFVSGPGATPVITSPGSFTTAVSNMTVAGSYTFRLSATDNSAATVTDDIIILVNPAPNQPPVVNAGNDTTFTMPDGSFQITLNGSATDDGTIISYLWTQVSGPTTATILSQTQKTTAVTNLYAAGVYVFRLAASDNFGVTSTDDVTVTIDAQQPPKEIPPTVNAGPDYRAYLCFFCGSIGVNVTAVATAGTYPIQAITWTKISGPAQGFVSSPNTLATRMSNLVRGTYTFQVTVTDAGGFSASDIMTIDVRKQWLTIFQGKVIIVDAP